MNPFSFTDGVRIRTVSQFRVEADDRKDNLFHGDSSVLESITVIIEVMMVISGIDEIKILFRDDIINYPAASRQFIIKRVADENSLPLIAFHIPSVFVS